jgi:hypothetical protein
MDYERDGGGPWRRGGEAVRAPPASLGALIADSRRSAGLTQRELAGLAGVGLGTVRDLEQGRSPVLARPPAWPRCSAWM